MVFKGSRFLAEGQFDLEIEALGGSSNAATGFDDVHFYVLVPTKVVPQALELLLDLVLDPSLCPEAFSTEREVVLEEIAQYHDQPEEQIFQKLLRTCWGEHCYGRPILGFKESLQANTPEQMRGFHERLYKAENCCLAIAGSIPKEIEDLVENSRLAALPRINSQAITADGTQNLFFKKGRIELEIPRLESARLLMAWPISPAKEQSMVIGADIATSLLAEGRRSRLVQRLREDLKIVESIDMEITSLEKGGLIVLEACCLEEQLKPVEKEVQKTMQSFLYEAPSSKELERASQLVRNGFYFHLEAPGQVAGFAGSQALWGRSQNLLEPVKHISKWGSAELQQEILSLLQPETSCTLIARPQRQFK